MTRQTITLLKALIEANLLDNNSQLITPAAVREVVNSLVDSMTPLNAMTAGSSAGTVIPLTVVPVKVPGTFFNTALSGDSTVMEGRATPNGDLLIKTDIGRLFVNFDVTITAGNGIDVVFTLAQNGVVLPFRSIISGRGNGNQISTSFSWLFPDINPGDTIDIRVASLSGTPDVTLFGAAAKGILLPQFN